MTEGGVIQRGPVPPSPTVGRFDFPGNRASRTTPLPVMVRRPHTTPARVEVVVGVTRRLPGRATDPGGTLEASGDVAAIQWFNRATGGTAIVIPPAGLPLTKGQLNAGFRMFAESNTPTGTVGGYVLTLVIAPGAVPPPVPPPTTPPPPVQHATVGLTAVRLTLDVFPPGPAFGSGAPDPMSEPPATAPAAGAATDKWFLGRTVNVQDSALAQTRARIRVRQVEPFDFTGNLSLQQRSLAGTTLGRRSARAALMEDDNAPPLPGTTPSNIVHPNPLVFAPPDIIGRDFFVEGRALSATRRDIAFQLGLDGGEPDGDRVAFTIGVGCSIEIDNSLRAVMVRRPNTSPARRAVTLRTNVAFLRQGIFNVAGNTGAIRWFETAISPTPLALPARLPGAQLGSADGAKVFAEGLAASALVDDVQLSLTLEDGSPPAGLPANARMTAVALTLDASLSRPLAGGDPPLMAAADRIATGRFVQVASPTFSHERAKVTARPPSPGLSCELVLRALGAPARVRLFSQEVPAEGQSETALPDQFLSGLATIGGGLDFFAEGTQPSASLRDTGFQLGIVGLDDDGDRVPMTALEFAVTENDTAAAPALSAVRLGLWDQGYNPGPAVNPNRTTLRANFIDNDRRRFHFHVRGPLGAANLQTSWRTVRANRTTADDFPASQILTLTAPVGGGRLVSPGVMLVIDDTDAAQPTPAARGAAEHRLRRARLDGFVRAEIQPSAGQFHKLLIPVFDRATPFDTTSASVVAAPGVATVVPAAMNGTATTGARWQIKAGSLLTIDTGGNQEDVFVTAVTAASFTASFSRAHDGSAAPFRIAGRTDERRRLRIRVVRYNNAADPTYVSARDVDIRDQFTHANLRWNQVGLQIDAGATLDRTIPAGALNGAGKFPVVHPDGAQEQAVLADLIPITPDNTLTAVFVDLVGANAYAAILQTLPVPLPAGGTVTMGDRFFVFLRSRLDPLNETLAHELHHVLHNRAHALTVEDHIFTFNTSPPLALAAARGIALPDSRFYRRIHVLNSADPNNDLNNDDVLNWFRRPRTARFPILASLAPATATTGNNLTSDF